MNTMNNVKVTVALIAYKHARYMRQCLDSILTQKCNFSFQIVISDDCSCDGTEEILKEYQSKYPDIIIPIIHQENLGASKNSQSLQPYLTGEYLSVGECDDFWTDENRLQKQVEYLDQHPDCAAVGTNFYNVDADGNNPYISMLKWEVARKYYMKDLIKNGLIIHGNTLLRRVHFPYKDDKYKQLRNSATTMGDVISRALIYDYGYIYVLPEVMHAHRMGTNDSRSFFAKSKTKAIELSYMFNNIIDALSIYFDGKYDFSLMKSNRAGLVLMNWLFGNYSIDRKDMRKYLDSMPSRIKYYSYERCVQKIARGVVHHIGRKLKMFYKFN